MIAMLRAADERVRTGQLHKSKFEELQLACAVNYNARGLLSSNALTSRFALLECVTYDWVHTCLQDGCFVVEASLMVSKCGDHTEATLRGRECRCVPGHV